MHNFPLKRHCTLDKHTFQTIIHLPYISHVFLRCLENTSISVLKLFLYICNPFLNDTIILADPFFGKDFHLSEIYYTSSNPPLPSEKVITKKVNKPNAINVQSNTNLKSWIKHIMELLHWNNKLLKIEKTLCLANYIFFSAENIKKY